jgi:hypothetical protein
MRALTNKCPHCATLQQQVRALDAQLRTAQDLYYENIHLLVTEINRLIRKDKVLSQIASLLRDPAEHRSLLESKELQQLPVIDEAWLSKVADSARRPTSRSPMRSEAGMKESERRDSLQVSKIEEQNFRLDQENR